MKIMKSGDLVKIHTEWSQPSAGETRWTTCHGLYIEKCPDAPYYTASRHRVLIEGVKMIVDTAVCWIEVVNEKR